MDSDTTQLLTETAGIDAGFGMVEETFRAKGAEAVFDALIRKAREENKYRMVFSVRLMQVRHRLGLPLVDPEPVPKLTEEQRPIYDQACREAALETGQLFLDSGDIAAAWPYFPGIGRRLRPLSREPTRAMSASNR